MKDEQKDLLQDMAEERRILKDPARAEVLETALKEVEALGALKLGIKLAAVAGRMNKTLAEDLLVLVETPNEPNEVA